MDPYYRPDHLARFGEVAEGSDELARKFFDYYAAVFAEGALSRREKALIALAVAHAVQCPYCIDAYSQPGRRPRADDRGAARGDRDPWRGLAGARPADAGPRPQGLDVTGREDVRP